MPRLLAEIRHAAVWTRWAIERAGYWARPYDGIADSRRWRWQPRTCCTCGTRHRRRRRA